MMCLIPVYTETLPFFSHSPAARQMIRQFLEQRKTTSSFRTQFYVKKAPTKQSNKWRFFAPMIDPKLDKLPAEAAGDLESIAEKDLTDEQRAALRRPRRGLSVKDTVAAGPSISVGARGFDVSGVEAGAGAGAGMTELTPGERGESPAPNIVPGARGSGNAPRGQSTSQEQPTISLDTDTLGPTDEEIKARAYQCWHERGCPHGSPEEDWRLAEEQLRLERARTQSTKTARGASA